MLRAQVPFADVLMPIDATAEFALAVVQVERANPVDSHDRIKMRHRFLILVRPAERIAGGKDMATVDAHAQAVTFVDTVEDRPQVLELVTQRRSLAGRRLQPDLHARAGCRRKASFIASTIRVSPSCSVESTRLPG